MRILIITVIIIFSGSLFVFGGHLLTTVTPSPSLPSTIKGDSSLSGDIPIGQAKNRITKKPFGIFISPNSSPITPEHFTGYHTGTDFEIFSGEENKDVSILALCEGVLVLKKYATGYGGVAVQSCSLNQQSVTVIYGHLNLASIIAKQGATLKRGDKIGILGKGFSIETDGERKHLHLGVHKGTTINIPGYVQKENGLLLWIDPAHFLN